MGGETTAVDSGQRERWRKETMRTGGESARSMQCSEPICLRVRYHPGMAQLWEPILAVWAKENHSHIHTVTLTAPDNNGHHIHPSTRCGAATAQSTFRYRPATTNTPRLTGSSNPPIVTLDPGTGELIPHQTPSSSALPSEPPPPV